MKTNMLITAIVLAVFTTFYSCESKQQKVEDAQQNLQDAKQNLRDAKNELNNEYPAFRQAEEREINDNENRIAELKRKINTGGKPLDKDRADRIQKLEDRNAELRSRLYGYEKTRSDWQTFKNDFKRDMDEFGNAIRNFPDSVKR